MLFRIEDTSGFNPKLRIYDVKNQAAPIVDKKQIDTYIATKIREEINGSKNRKLLSYSKSLATCLLKYNKYTDNELHICDINGWSNCISYISPKGKSKWKKYSMQDRLSDPPLFNKDGEIRLLNFVIDVSENTLLDEYLRYYTGTGKKLLASPEKDSEVIVMNPPNDLIINQYMDSVYILYALQLKYKFLNNFDIQRSLIMELVNMDSFRFDYFPYERDAFINLILYLSANWLYEYQISKKIYDYSENEDHISTYYDPILQFHGIIDDDFDKSYYSSSFNENVISDLFWKYCDRHLRLRG